MPDRKYDMRKISLAMIAKNGQEKQLRKLAEECSELTTESLHIVDGRAALDALILEGSHVEMMLDQLRCMMGDGAMDHARELAMARTVERFDLEDCYADEE